MSGRLPPLLRSDLVWATKVAVHVFLLGLAFVLAYEVRRGVPLGWWFTDPDAARVFGWAALYALLGAGVEAFFQTERSAWRFVSLREVLDLVRNVIVSIGLLTLAIFTIDRGFELPRSVLFLAAIFSVILLGCVRIAWRFAFSPDILKGLLSVGPRAANGSGFPLVIVGTLEAADAQIRQLLEGDSRKYQPVAIVTPHSYEVNLRLHGIPVIQALGQEPFKALRRRLSSPEGTPYAVLFVGDPIGELGLTPADVGELRRRGHTLLRPQRLSEFGGDNAEILREIPLEELLPRKPVTLDPEPVRRLIAGKRVLVTGAGGSIGSEIARQVVQFGCAHLTLLDHSEFLLFEIDRELSRQEFSGTRNAVLANVRDEWRIQEIFERERPELVFHAAALKHVTLVEINPAEGVLTNVIGTWNVLRAAIKAGADQFVLISTDKAVDPSNIMGATKRIAESLLEFATSGSTHLTAVRFGNVLGSAGSVVPIFRDQIARGGPITVTDPEVTRYFMTIPEAVQLVLHATVVKSSRPAEAPSKFLLEMGEPVRIVDLARQMIELSGKRPDTDIKIEFTGMKPGEKREEQLVDVGEMTRPCLTGIVEVTRDDTGDAKAAESDLEMLLTSATFGQREDLKSLLFAALGRVRQCGPKRMETPADE